MSPSQIVLRNANYLLYLNGSESNPYFNLFELVEIHDHSCIKWPKTISVFPKVFFTVFLINLKQNVPVYFARSCIMLLVSWRIRFSRGTSMRSRLQWDARPCTFTRIQSHPLTLMRTHIHTQKTPVALCTSLSGAGDVSPALVLSREIARPQTSACSLKLWVPPS